MIIDISIAKGSRTCSRWLTGWAGFTNGLVQKKGCKSVTFVASVMFLAASYCLNFENKLGSVKQWTTLEHITECY